jgi:hypothetical protein
VDLDGTLAAYHGWVEITDIGEPIAVMVDRVKRWLAEGYEVRVFTARASEPDLGRRQAFHHALFDWLRAAGLPPLTVTCIKDYRMVELYDDRAVQVQMNTGRIVGYSTRDRGLA